MKHVRTKGGDLDSETRPTSTKERDVRGPGHVASSYMYLVLSSSVPTYSCMHVNHNAIPCAYTLIYHTYDLQVANCLPHVVIALGTQLLRKATKLLSRCCGTSGGNDTGD